MIHHYHGLETAKISSILIAAGIPPGDLSPDAVHQCGQLRLFLHGQHLEIHTQSHLQFENLEVVKETFEILSLA